MNLPGSISGIRFSERDSTISALCISRRVVVYLLASVVICIQIVTEANAMSSRIPVVFIIEPSRLLRAITNCRSNPSNQSGEGESRFKTNQEWRVALDKKFSSDRFMNIYLQ